MAWLIAWIAVAWAGFGEWSAELAPPDVRPEVAENYRFTGEFFPVLAEAVRDRPGVVRAEALTETPGGHPIWAFHVSEPGVRVERKVLIFAGIHALEWISTEVAVDTLLGLIAHPVPGVQVTVIPLLNPDGRAKVENDLVVGRNTYRRGNLGNIDLNRDFAVHTEVRAVWAKIIPGYYHHSDVALSQPETRALDRLAARERYDRAASLHAFGGYFYFPWSGRFERPRDWARFVEIGRAMEKAQVAHAYRTRQLSRWGFFFRAQGSELDHLYGSYGTKTYLVELTRSGIQPLRPKTFRTYFRWYNPVRSARHRHKGVSAMRALVRAP